VRTRSSRIGKVSHRAEWPWLCRATGASGGRLTINLELVRTRVLQNPGLNPHVCGIINDGDFAGTDTRELYHILNSVYQRGSSPSYEPLEQLVPSALLTTIARARQSIESRSPLDGAGQIKDAVQCATRLKRTRLVQLNIELQYVLREAESTGDVAVVQQLKHKLLENQKQLRTIDSATHLQG